MADWYHSEIEWQICTTARLNGRWYHSEIEWQIGIMHACNEIDTALRRASFALGIAAVMAGAIAPPILSQKF